ncbi:MAG: GntR family transcriptional regulator [Anaerolineaceae bacterium]|jgi:GntR family transcriptional regulator
MNVNPQDFSLDFRSGVPVYVQLVEQVLQYLSSGSLKPGDQLPTVRQMAAALRVNFNTVARAYRMLDEAGLISTQQGRGTYIVDQPVAEKTAVLKRDALEAQLEHFFTLLERQGYTPAEVELSWQKMLIAWQDGSLKRETQQE